MNNERKKSDLDYEQYLREQQEERKRRQSQLVENRKQNELSAMRNTLYKNAEMAWDKEADTKLMNSSIERLARKERELREMRYQYRKHLDKNNTNSMEAVKQVNKASHTPNLSGPLSIEALGTNYPKQRQKMKESDMRQTMHNMSVERFFKEVSEKEITQERMTASPLRYKLRSDEDCIAEYK